MNTERLLDPRVIHPWLIQVWKDAHSGKSPNILIVGKRRTGKSWATLSIGELLNYKTFKVDHVAVSIPQFAKIISGKDVVMGDVLIMDDAGVGVAARKWASYENKKFDDIVQTWGNKNIIVIFNTPSSGLIDVHSRNLFDWILEPVGMDKHKGITYLKILKLQWNNQMNKMYYSVFRKNGRRYPTIAIPRPSKQTAIAYEKMANEWKAELRNKADEGFEEKEEQRIAKKINVNDIAEKILKDPEKYVYLKGEKKNITVDVLQAEFNLGRDTSRKLKAILESRLRKSRALDIRV